MLKPPFRRLAQRILLCSSIMIAASGKSWAQAPTITSHPVTQAVTPGGSVTLSLAATGSGPLTYQWTRNGQVIAGATNATYTITNAQLADIGRYAVIVISGSGSVTSAPAQVSLAGVLWGLGDNSYGQLGDGTTTARQLPIQVNTNCAVVAGGSYTNLHIKADGTLWGGGNNLLGQLADGTTTSQKFPVQVATNVKVVSTGQYHTLYAKGDATLLAAGDNFSGELGDGTTVNRKSPVLTSTNVCAVAAGGNHSLFLKLDGTLWSMGFNSMGNLGDGTKTARSTPGQVASNVATLAAGDYHSLFVKNDGTLWSVGYSFFGQLGDGTNSQPIFPISVASNVCAVAAGANHSLFLKSDGTLWAMGDNAVGQLGDRTITARSTPVQVATDVVAIAAGRNNSLYLKTDGTLWGMGDNSLSQLGDGTTTNRPSPVPIASGVCAAAVGGKSVYFIQQAGFGTGPTVTTPAPNTTYATGASITLSVTTTGSGPLDYRWRKDGVEILGARSSTLNFPSLQSSNFGDYTVVVTNSVGSVTSGTAKVVVLVAPAITTQPIGLAVSQSQNATFKVVATGTDPLTYQWRKDGVAVTGETSSILRLSNVTSAQAGIYTVSVTNSLGTVISTPATLVVNSPVTISSQPTSRTATLGERVVLSATAYGPNGTALTYQWRRDGISLVGATDATLTLSSVSDSDYGTYTVLIASPTGSVVSEPALLARSTDVASAPVITRQPRGATINAGSSLVLTVAASGVPAPSYQWQFKGVPLTGANTATLVLTDVLAAQAGAYTVVVTNPSGSVTSSAATVAVAAGFGRQLNVSTLGFVGTGGDLLIPGFVIAGSGAKRLLIRAVAPSLAQFGVTGLLADPQLAIFSGSTQVLSNDNWSTDAFNATAARSAAVSVGAFPLTEGSSDAALVATLNPGGYSIQVSGVGGTTGKALVELYDLDAADPARSRLVNLATRALVTAGGGPLISGFVVQGAVAKAVLVRATGPALATFGVPGTLARPKLTLFNNNGTAIATNTGWESAGISDAIIAASQSVGAFALARGSADSVVLAVLPPGSYTAQVIGADGAGGVTLIEVYELP